MVRRARGKPLQRTISVRVRFSRLALQSLLEVELLVFAGVLAGVLAGVGVDELPESLLDDDAVVEPEEDELSDDPALEEELEPPRLSVL